LGSLRLGIVPAAGKSERFGGTLKELLPYEGESFLRRTVRILMARCDYVVVITNPQKIAAHSWELAPFGNVYLVVQQGTNLLAAIKSVTLKADYYLFAMPDTLFSDFPKEIDESKFMIGLFNTTEGHKFGVWNGMIDDKNPENEGLPKKAWGLLGWPYSAMQILRETYLTEHTEAFNLALELTPHETFQMDYYYDIADFESYRELVSKHFKASF